MSALFLSSLLLLQAAGAAQPSTAAVKGADLELLEDVRQIASQVERLRQQKFIRPPIAVRTPDVMRGVAAEIRAYNVLTRERLAARGRAWQDLGLGASAESPARVLLLLAADLRGIGFDPAGNRLLVAPDRLTQRDFRPQEPADGPSTVLMMTGVRPDEPLIGHLLMHVRQRERAGSDLLGETTDRLLAGMAWAEGEANLVAMRYLFEGMGMADDVMDYRFDVGEVLEGSLLPAEMDGLNEVEAGLVRFVYLEGFAQAKERFKSGGWEALDQAMARRNTTRDLLHPERSPSVAVEFPEPKPPHVKGARLADQDSLGEQAIVVLISASTGKDNLGLQAGDGWTADRIYRWELPQQTGAGLTEWVTRWASREEAEEFDYCLGRSIAARFPDKPLVVAEDGRRRLESLDRVFVIERRETAVTIRIAPQSWEPPAPAAVR